MSKTCFHYRHQMFYRCNKHHVDNHLHCISCGIILADDENLREMSTAGKIIDYRYSCEKLWDNNKTTDLFDKISISEILSMNESDFINFIEQ